MNLNNNIKLGEILPLFSEENEVVIYDLEMDVCFAGYVEDALIKLDHSDDEDGWTGSYLDFPVMSIHPGIVTIICLKY